MPGMAAVGRQDGGRRGGRTARALIAGSGGLIGSAVSKRIEGLGHQVERLVRHAPAPGEVQWDLDAGTIDTSGLEGCDAVVRLRTSGLLTEALVALEHKPSLLVCGSGRGGYALSGDQSLVEDSPLGTDILAQLERDGEAATTPASAAGIRVVQMLIPTVLGGPNLAAMTKNVRRLGNGRR